MVPKAAFEPGYCCVTGNAQDEGGFIDTGNQLTAVDPHVYISALGAQRLGKFIGMVDQEGHSQALTRIAELTSKTERLLYELAEEKKFRESVHVIESKDFKAKKKAGRPRKKLSVSANGEPKRPVGRPRKEPVNAA